MNRFNSFVFILLVSVSSLHGWKGTETTGERPTFFGTLTSQEGNVFNVTNVTVGHSASSPEKVILYEMPKSLKESANGNMLTVNPDENLTTAQLELLKIRAIEVPYPNVMWKWKNPESTRATAMAKEYIEVIITWASGSKVHYLLELGLEDTKRPLKIFCDVVDKPLQGKAQDGTLFCPGINKTDLHKKGAPFPSIKILKLEEPCFKVPTDSMQTNKKTN
ncbi:MAG: hypothetical protein ACD_64C00301G0001 [uncultured bacterium]|jgi:hypothetical protein|nr:MAG: hypothetical protein ACD_64C00301G0001 [uncultured bacterium]HLE76383.1 hypothetical protein [Candidatus Babeliales bacterium]